jgi:hypothetical protein
MNSDPDVSEQQPEEGKQQPEVSEQQPEEGEHQPDQGGAGICMPCRGTGKLISGLGGEPHSVRCPWCRGTGKRIPGIDAQQEPAEAGPPPAQD